MRTAEKVAILEKTGSIALQATLDDLDALQSAALDSDAIIHTAFNHDFSKFVQNAEQDKRVIEALGSAIAGTDKKLIVTSGLSGLPLNANELDVPSSNSLRKSDPTARVLFETGLHVSTVRLAPSVHGNGDHGFIPMLIKIARETGISGYLGEGKNYWSGVHRQDAAKVYRLALEVSVMQPVYHAVADEAVSFKSIAESIGGKLGVKVQQCSSEHFGWFSSMVGANMTASSALTREALNWMPNGPSMLEDMFCFYLSGLKAR